MITQTHDAHLINWIANHESIREGAGLGEGQVADYTEALQNPGLKFLVNEERDAIGLVEFKGPRIWECHSMFLPSARGSRGIQTGRAMLEWMRVQAHAQIVWGQAPLTNRAARAFNRRIGMEAAGYGLLVGVGPVEYFIKKFDQ